MNIWENLSSMLMERPVRVILLCIGFWNIFTCIKNRYFLSASLMLIIFVLLGLITFTNFYTTILYDVSTILQFAIVAALTGIFCIAYEYESNKKM